MSLELLKKAILEDPTEIFGEDDPMSAKPAPDPENNILGVDMDIDDDGWDDFLYGKVDGAGNAIKYDPVLQERMRPKKPVNIKDLIKCDICGGYYKGKKNKTNHSRTKIHIMYESMNKQLARLILNDEHRFAG